MLPMIHVIPCDEGHRLDTTCDCEPEVQFLEQILVIHNCRGVENGWVCIEGDDNYPTGIIEDGIVVPVEIEE